MFIIFGTNSFKTGKKIVLQNLACPKCDCTQALFIRKRTRFVHLFFIPLIPYDSDVIVGCDRCSFEIYAPAVFRWHYEKLDRQGVLTQANFIDKINAEAEVAEPVEPESRQ